MQNYETEVLYALEKRKKWLIYCMNYLLRNNNEIIKKEQYIESKKVRIVHRRNSFEYYLKNTPHDYSGKYLNKEHLFVAQNILQYEYNLKIITAIQQELNSIDNYYQTIPQNLNNIYNNLSERRKLLTKPIIEPDEIFVKNWLSVEYEGKGFNENDTEYFTDNNERVRSKSELIIANILKKYNIPYRYEYPIQIKGMGRVYPDFTALNVKKRKEVIIEHFGMLDDKEYANGVVWKLARYELNDILLGDNLLITYETAEHPLSIPLLEKKIQQILL